MLSLSTPRRSAIFNAAPPPRRGTTTCHSEVVNKRLRQPTHACTSKSRRLFRVSCARIVPPPFVPFFSPFSSRALAHLARSRPPRRALPYINDLLMEWECSLTARARYFFPLSRQRAPCNYSRAYSSTEPIEIIRYAADYRGTLGRL